MTSIYMFKKAVVLIAALAALFSWGIITSVMLLKKSDKVILVGIDANGTRIITSSEDPLFKMEVVNFSKKFFSLLYNFDSLNFDQNIGEASDFMSLELWKNQEAKVLKLGADVKKEKITHSGELKSLAKNDDGSYEAIVHTSENYRAKSVASDLTLKFKIKKVERSEKNPWGMEITELEELKI